MRSKKPIRARIDQVHITRDGDDAIVECVEPGISNVRLTIGPAIRAMTDLAILDVLNGVVASQERLLAGWNRTVIEIPLGERPVGAAQRRASLHRG